MPGVRLPQNRTPFGFHGARGLFPGGGPGPGAAGSRSEWGARPPAGSRAFHGENAPQVVLDQNEYKNAK